MLVVMGLGCMQSLVAASLRLPSHSAARILKLRGGVSLAALQKDMQTALLTEDFKWANEIKTKMSKMNTEPQLATVDPPTTRASPVSVAALEEEKRIAVLCEDFQRAKELKNQIDEASKATASTASPQHDHDDVKAEINAARSAAANARFSTSTEEVKDNTTPLAVESNTTPEVEIKASAAPTTRNYDDVKAEINAARSAAANARFSTPTEEAKDNTAPLAVESNTTPAVESNDNNNKDFVQSSEASPPAPASSAPHSVSEDLLNAPLAADTLSSFTRLNSAQRATAPLPWVDRVAALEEAKRLAVEEEDFDKAESLKLEILAVLEEAYAKAKELRAEAADNSNWTASDHPPPESVPDSSADASHAHPDAGPKVAAEVAEAEKAAAQAEAALEAALAQKASAVSSARAAAEAAAERVAILRREL